MTERKLLASVMLVATIFAGATLLGALDGCTPAQLEIAKRGVASAQTKRDTICAFVVAWEERNREELKPLADLCREGAELEEIAALYAGCSRPGLSARE